MTKRGLSVNSRAKGARGERELAAILREHGYDARRGQQFSGANGDADVIGLEGIHIECKLRDRLNIEDAYAQARRDADRRGEIPTVMHRKTGDKHKCGWLVTMSLEHFMHLYKAWEREND